MILNPPLLSIAALLVSAISMGLSLMGLKSHKFVLSIKNQIEKTPQSVPASIPVIQPTLNIPVQKLKSVPAPAPHVFSAHPQAPSTSPPSVFVSAITQPYWDRRRRIVVHPKAKE